ncbi:MAG: aminoacyl-tRNA hydrolase [Zoogloeaceae bacterium]|nr:aminoacyl-tRNA hydrolase [Zoogloeaceae bacterium]MCK6383116.1 aminoacyl-tRNA hydrolase [Rhodocyclaceae bacterium]
MAAPRLIVGLGNPGAEYADTRHNAGFWLCERLATKLGAQLRRESRFHGLAGRSPGQVWLLLPQTFMNCSGQAVSALARFHRIPPAGVLVLHDELDLPPGALRLKFGGGLGGHNGLKDIAAHLGTQDFWRLRIGIGHPGDRNQVVDYVLKKPRSEERAQIDAALDRALDHWPLIARGEYPAAMQQLNAKGNP